MSALGSDAAIRMPQLGLTMTEGTLVEWLCAPGEPVAEGQVLFVVETEKIANEVAADRAGALREIVVPAGETVPVGAVLAYWADDASAPVPPREASASPAAVAAAGKPAAAGDADTAPERPSPGRGDAASAGTAGGRVRATPHARKLARARGVDLATLSGSGPGGRIKAADVLAAAAAPGRATAPAAPAAVRPVTLGAAQRLVAARMSQAKREIPHFYLEADADVGELLELHRRVKAQPGYEALTLTHWIALALGRTLATDPRFRRVQIGEDVFEHAGSDVGIATDTERGLYVPVARGLERKSLREAAGEIAALVARARAGRLAAADSEGGTSCVSNLGAAPIRRVFPIVIPGHSTILGVGRTNDLFRPDGRGRARLARELGLVLSCDHRVLNGVDGARLLEGVLARLADPLPLLLAAA